MHLKSRQLCIHSLVCLFKRIWWSLIWCTHFSTFFIFLYIFIFSPIVIKSLLKITELYLTYQIVILLKLYVWSWRMYLCAIITEEWSSFAYTILMCCLLWKTHVAWKKIYDSTGFIIEHPYHRAYYHSIPISHSTSISQMRPHDMVHSYHILQSSYHIAYTSYPIAHSLNYIAPLYYTGSSSNMIHKSSYGCMDMPRFAVCFW